MNNTKRTNSFLSKLNKYFKKSKAGNKKGFTLIEFLCCMFLMVFVFAMAFTVTSLSSTTYATEATRTQAEIFLSQNVAKISQMLRYADSDIGIITNRTSASPYISEETKSMGITINGENPLFCTRTSGGSVGVFVNNETTGEIDFLNTITNEETSVISNASDYKLRAEIIFFDGTETDYDDSALPEGIINAGTNAKQFDFEIRVYAESFNNINGGVPLCSSHQIIVPIENTLNS